MNENNQKICAVILAAGESRRMGKLKPLLTLGDKNFTQILKDKIKGAGIRDIYLVLGARAGYIKENLNTSGLNIIINKSWPEGQLSSLKAALKKIKNKYRGLMMFLIDHPQVKQETVDALLGAFEKNPEKDIFIPSYKMSAGHPVIWSRSVFDALLDAPLNQGARVVTKNPEFKKEWVNVDDPYIKQDIDTPQDLRQVEDIDGK
ncbi:MAG: nucleotidyltransferase family protein [Elusimicrobiota bacterium]